MPKLHHWPRDAELLVAGDCVRARALAHAVELQDGNVEAHEEVKRVFGDGRSTGETDFAAVQAKRGAHLLKNQIVGYGIAPRHQVLSATKRVN